MVDWVLIEQGRRYQAPILHLHVLLSIASIQFGGPPMQELNGGSGDDSEDGSGLEPGAKRAKQGSGERGR